MEAANLKRKQEAEQVAAKMAGLKVVIIRQAAETGQLYGSVTGRDVRDAIRSAGFMIERSQVLLDLPYKAVGDYTVRIKLHPDVEQTVAVAVARSNEEAERNAKAAEKAAAEAAAAEAAPAAV